MSRWAQSAAFNSRLPYAQRSMCLAIDTHTHQPNGQVNSQDSGNGLVGVHFLGQRTPTGGGAIGHVAIGDIDGVSGLLHKSQVQRAREDVHRLLPPHRPDSHHTSCCPVI